MFDISFIKKVIHRFTAPFVNEQNQLSSIVIQFLISNPEKVEQVVKIISSLFIDYLYGGIGPYAIAPSLAVFHVINDQCPNITLNLYFSHFLPLLRAPHFVYFQDIFYQILFNIFKDKSNQRIALPTIRYLIKHWPKTRSAKQVNFFNILTLAMTNLEPMEFQEIMVPVFNLIALSSCSENQKIASAAFSIWTPIEIELMIMDNSRTIFPIVYKPVSEALKDHWSTSVLDILQSILRTMDRIDPYAYHEVSRTANQSKQSNISSKGSFGQNGFQNYDSVNHGFFKDSHQDYYSNNGMQNNNFYLNSDSSNNSFYHSNNINNLFSSNDDVNSYSNFSNNTMNFGNMSYNSNYYDNSNGIGHLPSINKKSIKKYNSHSNSILISNYNNSSYSDYNQFNNHNNLRGSFLNGSSTTSDEESDTIRLGEASSRRRIGSISTSNSSFNRRIMTLLPIENMDEDSDHEKVRTWASIVKMASMVDNQINVPKKLREIQKEFAKKKMIRFSKSLTTIMKGLRK